MIKLYDVELVEPLGVGGTEPDRLGFQSVAWCEGLDLIAVVSGDGNVSVFHADAPGENAVLTTPKNASARHVQWQPAGSRPPALLVADSAGRITFWASRDYRVNAWKIVGKLELRPSVMAIGWTRDASMLCAVLSHGELCVWRISPKASGELDISELDATGGKFGKYFDGPVACASIAPGGVSVDKVAVLTVMESTPSTVNVWHISPEGTTKFQRKALGSAELENDVCIAAAAAPTAGALFAVGENGSIERWMLGKSNQSDGQGRAQTSESQWIKAGIHLPFGSISGRPKVTSVNISADGVKVVTTDTQNGVSLYDGRRLGDGCRLTVPLDRAPHWGSCFSPSGFCVAALSGDGVLQIWAMTAPATSPGELALQLITRTKNHGKRGCWDILALLLKLGKETVANVAKELGRHPGENVDVLRLKILSAVDENASVLSAGRKLLEAATNAIQKSACQAVKSKVAMVQGGKNAFTRPEMVRQCVLEVLSSYTNVPPRQSELSAAPMADWIILLCIVWLRQAARAVERRQMHILSPEWSTIVEADGLANDEKMTVVKDVHLTKSLRTAAIAAAILTSLDDEYGDPDLSPRYHRLKKDSLFDVVSAVWDVSIPVMDGIDSDVPGINSALARHRVAAEGLNNEKLLIDTAEKALGIRGSANSAGYTLSYARKQSSVESDQLSKEWCPYDIITGRPLPPWVPLRRCVVSGLLAAEMTAPQGDGDVGDGATLVPWVQRWAHESPFGGLWFRLPSLDLDRFDLMQAVTYNEERPNARTDSTRPAQRPDQSYSSSNAGSERTTAKKSRGRGRKGDTASKAAIPREPIKPPPQESDLGSEVRSEVSGGSRSQRGRGKPRKRKTPAKAEASTPANASEDTSVRVDAPKQYGNLYGLPGDTTVRWNSTLALRVKDHAVR
ncbi:hypothetical protein NDN08_007049 [Rhodosorus marinus]|uniref:Anaphase-promoting complex subunit 4-like WD40 domain-containing protein n=1 Tax=Rhodosorus marinus TaxID=101924 RepID=A0AAV8UFF4_9RHOD|nr:hypothetical protein NDN08_007049 [Rhodosorus marinus]